MQLLTHRSSRSLPFLGRVYFVTVARPRHIPTQNIDSSFYNVHKTCLTAASTPEFARNVHPLSSRIKSPYLLTYQTATSAVHLYALPWSAPTCSPSSHPRSSCTPVRDLRTLSCASWCRLSCSRASSTERSCMRCKV
jgi:hypothetical protein